MIQQRQQPGRWRRRVAVLLLSAAALGGCHTAQIAEPLTDTLAGNTPEQQMEFWHTLYSRSLTSNDEAFHAVLLFVDGKDEAADFAARVETLKTRGLLHKGFDEPAHQAVSRGTLAVIIVNVLKIKGGVMLTLLGPTPRYATRELQYVGIYPTSSPRQTFTGGQFVSIIGRMEDYQRAHPVEVPASVLPDEPANDKGAGEGEGKGNAPDNGKQGAPPPAK